MAARKKARLTKTTIGDAWTDNEKWKVIYGELRRGRGRPSRTKHLFHVVGEKLPFAALSEARYDLRNRGHKDKGVYVAHDSMGCPRYIGRGDIFQRLGDHHWNHSLELQYFSFYVVADKTHEREIETLLIRAAGFLLEFNERKKQVGLGHGRVGDFEAGTRFYERPEKKGRKAY